MSASLVGSEMCIRDSPSVTPQGAPDQHLSSPDSESARKAARTSPLGNFCLLYTSDAADDM
eukprot:14471331-Alexandrium_andersonii.AAC.1